MKTDETIDKYFYITGWIMIVIIAIVAIVIMIVGKEALAKLPPCTLHAVTGYYCPGCGGTRAVFALLRGDIIQSVRLHPIVLYAVVLGGWFMVSQTIQRITKGELHIGLHFRGIYVWLALALIMINCIAKNAYILMYGVHLLD